MNIKDIKFDLEVSFSQDTFENKTLNKDLAKVFPLRHNTILYKSKTGLGATYNEIEAPRHSIIVLPHISIIKNKQIQHEALHDTFAVYGGVSSKAILGYLTEYGGVKKFLTTPQGLNKIIKAVESTNANFKEEFFLLIDECHKLVQDAQYRADMVDLMEHFFNFKYKAMVSATPIPPSDPRFTKQRFKNVRVYPSYENKKSVKLIHADSVVNGLKDYLANNTSTRYCIFFNSIAGILSIIQHLKLDDYKIHCSQESSELLSLQNELKAVNVLSEYATYNFFTSSFFNGLDIILDHDAEMILLSDCSFQEHTLLDPYTDVLQIIGRTRNEHQKAVHINNSSRFTNPPTESQILSLIEKSKVAFELIEALKLATGDLDVKFYLNKAMQAVRPYYNMLDAKGNYSFFLSDNYKDDNRIAQYYRSPSALKTAYMNTNLYEITEERQSYERSEILRLQSKSIRYNADMNKFFADTLLSIEEYSGTDVYYKEREIIERLSPMIYEAYELLGYTKLEELHFTRKAVNNALQTLYIKEKKISFPMLNLIYRKFHLNRSYLASEIKPTLQQMYDDLDIVAKAKGTDIDFYFITKEFNKSIDSVSHRAYILQERKFNI